MTHEAISHLRAYGYAIEDNDGGLVRMKHGRVYDKFVPVDGGFHYYIAEDGAWVQRVHHYDGTEPVDLWPDEDVTRIYRTAVEERAARAAGDA